MLQQAKDGLSALHLAALSGDFHAGKTFFFPFFYLCCVWRRSLAI